MIFYGKGVVWNPKKHSRLCRFVDGKCDVTDENEIAFLVRAGYAHEPIDYGDKVEPVNETVEETEKEAVAAPTKKRVRKTNASDQLDS